MPAKLQSMLKYYNDDKGILNIKNTTPIPG